MKAKTKKILKRVMWTILSVILFLVVGTIVFLNQPSFGRAPRGERLERIKKSPNYKDGKFHNMIPTVAMATDKSAIVSLYEFLYRKTKDLTPAQNIPAIKTDLKLFNKEEDLLVWLGHSSLFMQVSGKRILVDPSLIIASPLSAFNKAFKGADLYRPENIPDIDYIIISHDHWDHLDYNTMLEMKNRTKKVICPLGVGEHLEYWGFTKNQIIELDWNENVILENNIVVSALPARHFSGRGFIGGKALWASYMLQSPLGNIYISGDTGYDPHFLEIKKRFGRINLAIMENGQYNEDWKYIHLMPDDLVKAVKDLNPDRLLTVHNSKYAEARHAWYEPLDNISRAAERESFPLITPMIGETVRLKDSTQTFGKWWGKR